jgi:virginiamycin B lyase
VVCPPRGTFQSWAIPGGGDIVGNRDVSRDGNLIMANGLVNTVGLIEISGP